MPHLRLQVPEEWLREEFTRETGFDAHKLMDHLVETIVNHRMENPAIEARRQELIETVGAVSEEDAHKDAAGNPIEPATVPFINVKNLKHAIIPVHYSGVATDRSKGFLHCTMSAGNDTPGRTAAVRRRVSYVLGDAIDAFVGDLPGLASVTVQVQDIERDRGYTTTAVRKKRREKSN